MKPDPPCHALLHGPEAFCESARQALGAGAFRVEIVEEAPALAACLAAGGASVALVHASALDGVLSGRGTGAADRRVPVLACGCSGAPGALRALEAGATLAARSDAGPAEIRSLALACAAGDELQRDVDAALDDLARQRTLALKDDLTCAWNRRFFERALVEALARARRSSQPLSLIFLDIDNLKNVNRVHGHPAGSEVLREAAARAIACVRDGDSVVRYGGDEFCVLLPETEVKVAVIVAERVRDAISARPFTLEGGVTVGLTASFGIAAFPEHATDPVSLVKAADMAMSRIKESRKNGLLVSGEPGP